ncbi:beta-glucosidase [Marmoricola sp. OAE513]|uniref:beta-glucosidase family protein n=1 Tax=Marmoricola sp. OAE513 TaxID=2817894 RepID=UPI001AE6F043
MRLSRLAGLACAGLVVPLLATAQLAGSSRAAEPPAPPVAPCTSSSAHPWCDTSLSPDARALLFQKAMTLDEEIALLGGQGAANNGATGGHTGVSVAVPRLGLPEVYFTDGPVGVRQGKATAMPVPIALAATWDAASAYEYGRTIGEEARAKGNDVVLGPTVNLARTPQNGRGYEAYGEETQLIAQTGVAWIKGAQSTGVIADVKHFALNNQEGQFGVPPLFALNGSRHIVNAEVDDRTLHELYLPHFEAAVKQGDVGTVMCSYNRINGEWACQNAKMLQTILEEQWGFKGFVVADYGASKDTVRNLNNGLDFVPAQGSIDQAYSPVAIGYAVASGRVKRSVVDGHVRRILRTLFAFGYFDRLPFLNDDTQIDNDADRATAQRIEERAITLLKNNGILPLKPSVKKIAVIGPYAKTFITGGGSGGVSPTRVVTALEAITARAGSDVTVTYTDGASQTKAAAMAAAADVAIVITGDVQTEGQDKSCIGLSCTSDFLNSNSVLIGRGKLCLLAPCPLNGINQDAMVGRIASAQPNTVAVLETGGPVLTPWRDKVAGLVQAWYPGQEGGSAIARVLFGDVDPGGRLPVTFPANADQGSTAHDPDRYPGADHSEGLLVGYRWYDAKGQSPAYEFGAGLSYTTFSYGPVQVQAGGVAGAASTATVEITNTGSRAGYAVPQVYLSKPSSAAFPQPVRQLVSSKSVSIEPGRTVRVSFPLSDRSFASWDTSLGTAGGWRTLPGCYTVTVGKSSRELLTSRTVARGATCPDASVSLGSGTDFFLPLAPPATVVSVD